MDDTLMWPSGTCKSIRFDDFCHLNADGGASSLMPPINRRAFLQSASLATICAGNAFSPSFVRSANGTPPGPRIEVKEHLGKPCFFIDGLPFRQPVFETYVPQLRYFQQFASAGTRVFSFSINLGPGFGPDLWKGPDQYDFAPLDDLVRRVLEAQPQALIMPRIYLTTPTWWIDSHPQEQQQLGDGSTRYAKGVGHGRDEKAFASLASRRWRDQTAAALRKVIEHTLAVDYRDHLFGYILTGLMSEEWYHWSIHTNQLSDYSQHATDAFREWLKTKYESPSSLRKAWNHPTIDFDSVTVPAPSARQHARERTFRDPPTEMPVIDWYLFYNDLVPDTMEVFLRAAKQSVGDSKVVGAFYCYMFEFGGDPEYGHNALAKLLRSPHLDFAAVTASYFNRHLGAGADYARAPITSVAHHGKLWYHDNDTVSFRYDAINEARTDRDVVERYRQELGVTTTPQESIWQYRRGAGFVLGNGIFQSFFDLHGGYFDDPQLMEEVGRLNQLLASSTTDNLSSVAEILVVSDEVSCSYATFESGFLQQSLQAAQLQFAKIGAPHDSILLSDLTTVELAPYKFILFLNCFHLSASQRSVIEERVLGKGRVILWCSIAGLFDGNRTSIETARALTRLYFVPPREPDRIQARIDLSDEGQRSLNESIAADQKLPRTVGHPHIWIHPFTVEDRSATTLGVLAGRSEVALVSKRLADWTSIYSANPVLPAAILRGFAKLAGVHIYSNRDDTLYVSRQYLSMNADGAGDRLLRFPQSTTLKDPFSNEILARQVDEFRRTMLDKETLILHLTSKPFA
jgi:hypothetical protein